MLVVLEQSIDRRGDYERAAGDAGNELHPAALRRAGARAGHLQVAKHTADASPDSRQHLPASSRGWPAGHAHRHTARYHAAVPVEFRAVRWLARGTWACRRSLATSRM